MSFLQAPTEKRYAQYPRRYLNEYYLDARTRVPQAKGSCATLSSARAHAVRAVEQGFCSKVVIFDRKIGQYVLGYKGSKIGVLRYEGMPPA